MTARFSDGSAGDADYAAIGGDYTMYRQPEPEFAASIEEALGDARSVLNVGAGAGSYEPTDRDVIAVEPSAQMRAQRPAHLTAAVDAVAEALPFADDSFDAAMSTFSVHQWKDLAAGLRELRRVTRGPVVLMTYDPAYVTDFWLHDYAPLVLEKEAVRYPTVKTLQEGLGGSVSVRARRLPTPLNCVDGLCEAYYGRPERLLDPGARRANSAWSFVDEATAGAYVEHLRADLESGAWDEKYGHLRSAAHYVGSLSLVVGPP